MTAPRDPLLDVDVVELHGLARLLIESVYIIILCVTITGWAVIGFGVWVPLLIKATAVLAWSVLYATLFRDQGQIRHTQAAVHFAVRFWIQGFRHFTNFYRQRHDQAPQEGLFEPLAGLPWKAVVIECVWVVAVWIGLYWLLRAAITLLL